MTSGFHSDPFIATSFNKSTTQTFHQNKSTGYVQKVIGNSDNQHNIRNMLEMF
jgi:hypothetical protein